MPGRAFHESDGAADGANAATVASVAATSARHSAVEAREGAMSTNAQTRGLEARANGGRILIGSVSKLTRPLRENPSESRV